MSEQRVRDLLDEVARPVPPPDLAEQAWRRAGRIRHRRLAVAGAAATVAAVVAGIAFLVPTPRGDETLTAQDLRGRTFASTIVTENGRARELADDMPISLEFTSNERFEGLAGCGAMTGQVRPEDGRLDLIRWDRATTAAAYCTAERTAQDQWLATLLEAEPSYRLTGETLVVTSGTTTIVLREFDETLVDRAFLSTEVSVGGKRSDVLGGVRVRLAFARDGELQAGVGCNELSGPADLSDHRLRVRLGTTDMSCGAVRAQESWLGEFLRSEPAWQLDGHTLVLTSGEVELRLVDVETREPFTPVR
jgi:heat shock protein HslJ